jgi:hypothetical protein
MNATFTHSVSNISLDELPDEYHRRHLDELSDVQLVRNVGRIVAEPRRDEADSFVLHAPLELAARAALLPRVTPDHRETARLRILAIAGQYESFGPSIEPSCATNAAFATSIDPQRNADELADALANGDLERTDVAASAVVVSMTPRDLIAALVDVVTPLTGAAAHAPIFLNQLLRGDPRGGITTDLLRPLARDLARNPTWRIAWTDDWVGEHPTDATALRDMVAATPRRAFDGFPSIHPLIQNVDASGVAAERLGDVVGRYDSAAARSLLRVAAMSMLQENAEHAPYGWTHCLTIPQAVLGVASLGTNPHLSLAVAATQVTAFRAALGRVTIDPDAVVRHRSFDLTRLATEAAISHDAHVAKYVLACFDAASDDNEFAELYFSAAQRLLDTWSDRGGDPSDPLR